MQDLLPQRVQPLAQPDQALLSELKHGRVAARHEVLAANFLAMAKLSSMRLRLAGIGAYGSDRLVM